MKRCLLIALAVFSYGICNAQFTLTSNGYRAEADTSKIYVVLTIPGSTQEENFAKAKEFIVSTYVSPKDVLSETTNIISINGIQSKLCKAGMSSQTLDVMYTAVLTFRDDRIKIDFPLVDMTWANAGRTPLPLSGGNTLSMFNKKGELGKMYRDTHHNVVSIPNDFVERFQKYMTNQTEDNW